LASDGSQVAASADGTTFVWNTSDPDHPSTYPNAATALTFTPDGTQLALGDASGRIVVHSLICHTDPITIDHGRTEIHCFAFSPDPRCRADGRGGWLLASGDAAGAIVIWDLTSGHERSVCHGSEYDVFALAFSPDGMTLASAGRYVTKLWDVATGAFLLDLLYLDNIVALAFSPDGKQLARGSRKFIAAAGWRIDDLEWGKGVIELRGLSAPISKVVFAPRGRRVAALAHDWRIACWDLDRGKLLSVLDGPIGISADNAALAFSPDGRQIALSAGRLVQLRDVETGRVIDRWEIPPGLRDGLRFPAPDRLLSYRLETIDGQTMPSRLRSDQHPLVFLMRNLLGAGRTSPIRSFYEFNRRVDASFASLDGRLMILEGEHEGTDGRWRAIKAFEVTTGTVRWRIPDTDRSNSFANGVTDPLGEFSMLGNGRLVEVSTGRIPRTLTPNGESLGPHAHYWLAPGLSSDGRSMMDPDRQSLEGFTLCNEAIGPLLSFGLGTLHLRNTSAFDHDGRLLAWGSRDGVVFVCNIDETRRRLDEFGLAW
jgi:WD40 repeat protein